MSTNAGPAAFACRGDKVQYFIDGDQLCITHYDFVNLQESPAVFLDLESDEAQRILKEGSVRALGLVRVLEIQQRLQEDS